MTEFPSVEAQMVTQSRQRRPSWEGENYTCSHSVPSYNLCSKCNREAAEEEIQREMITVLRELSKVLELLVHPIVVTSEPKP